MTRPTYGQARDFGAACACASILGPLETTMKTKKSPRRRCVRVDAKGRFSKTGRHRKCFTVRKRRG